jgi:DNA-binding SARP family transcriptional activator
MARREASPTVPVRLRTLGPIELTCAEPAAAARIVAQPKRLAVLAFLAARRAGERVSRDRILATFWPELPAARAQGALRNTLYFLRGALGGASLPGRGGAVGVSPDHVECDAADLLGDPSGKSASSLLDLHRGEFLDGLHIAGAPDFERWVDRTRAALRSRATELAWSLSKESETLGEWITAARYARRAADLAVDVEGASQRLIRLLDRAGDRAAALA